MMVVPAMQRNDRASWAHIRRTVIPRLYHVRSVLTYETSNWGPTFYSSFCSTLFLRIMDF